MKAAALLMAITLVTLPAGAQDEATSEGSKDQGDRIDFDLSFDHDPEELRESIGEKIRFKRIWGPVGLAGYHIFPAAEVGPWQGPPMSFWSNGFGTSLWRDPVTGWPLQ